MLKNPFCHNQNGEIYFELFQRKIMRNAFHTYECGHNSVIRLSRLMNFSRNYQKFQFWMLSIQIRELGMKTMRPAP